MIKDYEKICLDSRRVPEAGDSARRQQGWKDNPLIFIDPDGMIVEFAKNTSDEDKKKFLARQKELNSESRRARRQWNKLEKSKNVHTIHLNENDENGNRRNSQTIQKGPTDNKKGNGTDIYMDLDEKSPGGDELDTQGHEQAHALDLDKGKLKDIKPESDTKEDIEKAHNQMLIVGETRASKVENKIRKQRGTELRETYFIPLGFEYDPESGFNKMNYHVIQLVKKKKKKDE